ncbi:MAG: FMN-binding protein [Deltaproteobacteria bacterium]|nr:FMN-binding protein [Deltaproteobacteria bacterium]MBW1818204.1 FMN-binding protein [Deltaproteobacteria bacterium]MBW2283789.1 FMN-binding protein [Deltaproteobacteria bacterium]
MKRLITVIFTGMFFLAGCAMAPVVGGPVSRDKITDGVYDGSYGSGPNRAEVRVTIRDRAITDIQVVEHWAWRGKGAETIVVERIIASQSTDVDAVSGATNSSRVIMNAVQAAIEKAVAKEPGP